MPIRLPFENTAADADRRMLDACFLGPYGENDTLLEKLMLEFFRDHVHWRRNFHPEDPPAIPTAATHHPRYQAFEARTRHELHQLSAALKQSVPFHSPRYIGHMASDLLLPGLAAQMMTLPYNPNNVSEDAAPVTVQLEVRVGLQLARMLGFPSDPAQPACAMGHLCSGGTSANYQALRLALARKAFPVALRAAGVPMDDLPEDDWQAFNLGTTQDIALYGRWLEWLGQQDAQERQRWTSRVEQQRVEHLGLAGFLAAHPQLQVPRVLVPITAHYSWSKGMKLLGLGRQQLELVPTLDMRLDADALDATIRRLERERVPVLAAMAVLGSTEYGTIDPIDAVIASRDAALTRGFGFSVHVDGAWGGYLTTLFRNEDGSFRTREDVRSEYRDFPKPAVHRAFEALARVDSVTVDPHKLGYLPYGAGAFICRDHRIMGLLSERADYVFSDGERGDYHDRYRQLGQFVLEGSKPGAAAAAVYVTHKVLPLDHRNFGLLPKQTILAAEAFCEAAARFAVDIAPWARVQVLTPPDSNLVCLALNPAGNEDLAFTNAFVRQLYNELRCDPGRPVQVKQFFASITTVRQSMVGAQPLHDVLVGLGIEPATLSEESGVDHLVILRHTLMNPYLLDVENGISYIARYFEHLGAHLRSEIAPRMAMRA